MRDALSCVACEQVLLSGGCLVQTAGDLAMLTQRLTSEEGMTMMRRCLAHPISGEANVRCDSMHTRLATNTVTPCNQHCCSFQFTTHLLFAHDFLGKLDVQQVANVWFFAGI
jgi:hypothetical protein